MSLLKKIPRYLGVVYGTISFLVKELRNLGVLEITTKNLWILSRNELYECKKTDSQNFEKN